MNLPNDPNVKSLARVMDLDMPTNYLVVSDYEFKDGVIVINKIKVFDSKGEFIKFANNKNAMNGLKKFPVAFEK